MEFLITFKYVPFISSLGNLVPVPAFDTIRIKDINVINHSTSLTVKDTEIREDLEKGEHGDFLYEHGAMKEHR